MGEGARARGPRPASAHAPTRGDMVDGMAGGLDDLRLGGAGPVAAAPVRDAAAELREGAAAQLERCLLPLSLTLTPTLTLTPNQASGATSWYTVPCRESTPAVTPRKSTSRRYSYSYRLGLGVDLHLYLYLYFSQVQITLTDVLS